MAQVLFKRKTTAEIESLTIIDGQLIYDTENGKQYMDNGTERIQTGGTTNYTDLTNKPSINGVELSSNKTLEDLGITDYVDSVFNSIVNGNEVYY